MTGCYICRPEDPTADEEGCDACDRAFWSNPVGILIYLDDLGILPSGPRFHNDDHLLLVAKFRAMPRREKRRVERLARAFYSKARHNERARWWAEGAQLHPGFVAITDEIWARLPRRWRGSAICQLLGDVCCAPVDDMPIVGWDEMDLAIGLIRETNP